MFDRTDRERWDEAAVRAIFPAFSRDFGDRRFVYLDSASTAQKPRVVIDAMARAAELTANVHRGVTGLSAGVTRAFEDVRTKVAAFLGAKDRREIVFVRGATEALNLVAQTYGRESVGPNDEVIVTELEHHANWVPWQMLCKERGAKMFAAPIDGCGDVDLARLESLVGPRTRIVAIAHVANSIGTVVPIEAIARLVKEKAPQAIVVVDGAQAVAHRPVDVSAAPIDFYAFSGHKLYGPTGAGALWGRRDLLEAMPPWQGGGEMILSVSLDETTYNEVPHKFEAGTPDILGVLGLGAAIDRVSELGLAKIATREADLLAYASRALASVGGLRFVGEPRERASAIAFNVGKIHPHDLGTALDFEGVLVRAGHHCAQPAMRALGVEASVRASFGVYTTRADIDALVAALDKSRHLLEPNR